MELIFKDYEYKGSKINFKIDSKSIIGITGDNLEEIIDIIKLKYKYKGSIIINNEEINKSSINLYKRKIKVVNYQIEKLMYYNIYEIMDYVIRKERIYPKQKDKKIKDSLKIVGLRQEILDQSINSISTSELKLLKIALSLISNPEIIIIENPYEGLDLKNIKKIDLLYRKIKDQYDKTIIFISKNTNILYKYSEKIIVFKDNKIITQGKTKDVFTKISLLKENNIEIPSLVYFTYKTKKMKKVKLDYHQDIRDLIKDIYKHV